MSVMSIERRTCSKCGDTLTRINNSHNSWSLPAKVVNMPLLLHADGRNTGSDAHKKS